MRNVKLDSKKNSDTTSPTKRQLLRARKSERSVLADQAADAKTAMIQTLHDMKETLKRVADVPATAKQHPWLVVGSAVAAGFATGALLTHSPRRRIEKKLSKLETESVSSCQARETTRTKKSFLFSTLGDALTGILKMLVQSAIAAATAAATAAAVVQDQPPVETLPPHDSTESFE